MCVTSSQVEPLIIFISFFSGPAYDIGYYRSYRTQNDLSDLEHDLNSDSKTT